MADPIDETWMSTRLVAELLGMKVRFVVDEIKDGRMGAMSLEGRKRPVYRVTPDQYRAYIRDYWRPVVRQDQRKAS